MKKIINQLRKLSDSQLDRLANHVLAMPKDGTANQAAAPRNAAEQEE